MEKKIYVILQYLDKHKISIRKFAELTGVSRYTLHNHLNNRYPMRPHTARRIVSATKGEITLEELLN